MGKLKGIIGIIDKEVVPWETRLPLKSEVK